MLLKYSDKHFYILSSGVPVQFSRPLLPSSSFHSAHHIPQAENHIRSLGELACFNIHDIAATIHEKCFPTFIEGAFGLFLVASTCAVKYQYILRITCRSFSIDFGFNLVFLVCVYSVCENTFFGVVYALHH